jgi:DNA-binding protein HU-beta
MNKAEIIQSIARKTNLDKTVVDQVINSMLDEVVAQMKNGQEVTFAGFGSFMPKARHARMGVNPLKPTERIQMPETVVAKFKAGKTLKDALKPHKEVATQSAPETTVA